VVSCCIRARCMAAVGARVAVSSVLSTGLCCMRRVWLRGVWRRLQADICQLGMDQRKVNMLAREYCDEMKPKRKFKPVILSHRESPPPPPPRVSRCCCCVHATTQPLSVCALSAMIGVVLTALVAVAAVAAVAVVAAVAGVGGVGGGGEVVLVVLRCASTFSLAAVPEPCCIAWVWWAALAAMLMGLKENQEKMSKSVEDSAIFMEDTAVRAGATSAVLTRSGCFGRVNACVRACMCALVCTRKALCTWRGSLHCTTPPSPHPPLPAGGCEAQGVQGVLPAGGN
jgi:hypothetical protein